MTINLSDSLGKIRNYILEFDIAILKADPRYMGGLEFGFSQTVDAPLTDDRGIRLVWDNGVIGSDCFAPCGSSRDFEKLWTHVVQGKVCKYRFFVQKHRFVGVTITCDLDVAIFCAEDKSALICDASSLIFDIQLSKESPKFTQMTIKHFSVEPMEDCTVGVYRGAPPREKQWYNDTPETIYQTGAVLHYMDFSRLRFFKDSNYFLTNDTPLLYAGINDKRLKILTGMTPAQLLFWGNAIPRQIQSYHLRIRFRFCNGGGKIGIYHDAKPDLGGKLGVQTKSTISMIGANGDFDGFSVSDMFKKRYVAAVQKHSWMTATYICKEGKLQCVRLELADGLPAESESLLPTATSHRLVGGAKGIRIGAESAIEISDVLMLAGDCDGVPPIWLWPECEGDLVTNVFQTPTELRHYQLGLAEEKSALRLIGLINHENYKDVLESYGFSLTVKTKDGNITKQKICSNEAQVFIPSVDELSLDPCSAIELDRMYIYASEPLLFDTASIEEIRACAFAIRSDGKCITDCEKVFTVENGKIVSDEATMLGEIGGIFGERKYGSIPSYRKRGFDYLIRSEYNSYHVLVENTSCEEYEAYLEKLEKSHGFTPHDRREVNGNLFASYTDGRTNLFVNYIAYQKTVRIAADLAKISALPPLTSDFQKAVTTPQLTQINACHCFLLRLSDGRFIIHDGGMDFECNHTVLFEQLNRQNVLGGKPVIAAWMFSHMHNDHVGTFGQFWRYAHQVELQRVIWNIPSYDIITVYGQRAANTVLMCAQIPMVQKTLSKYFPKAQIIIPHAGQMMQIGDATIEVLYTHEDFAPIPMTETNNTSTVYRIGIAGQQLAILGDLHHVGSKIVYKMYGNDGAIKCDILQVAHHGLGGGDWHLYDALNADTALWTNNYEQIKDLHLYNRPDVFNLMAVKENLIMSKKDTVLILPLPHKVGNSHGFERHFSK